ncbi:hypothetical protein ELI98_30130, partial [Klebsiella pneumoniae]|nr:hypothetical protein [Klebsiella pneumoniae]
YSWKLGLIVVLSIIMLVVVMRVTTYTLKQRAHSTEVTDAKLQSVTMTGIKNMETIKSMGAERVFFDKWDQIYVKALNSRVRSTMSMLVIGSAPILA